MKETTKPDTTLSGRPGQILRNTIYAEASARLKDKLDWLDGWNCEFKTGSIVTYFELAEQLRDIKDNPAIYGRDALRQFAEYANRRKTYVDQMVCLTKAFSRSDIQKLASVAMANRKCISVTHLTILATKVDHRWRKTLIAKMIAEGWTVARLSAEIRELPCHKKANGTKPRGRPLRTPRGFDDALRQQRSIIEDVRARNVNVWKADMHSLSTKSKLLASADFTEDRLERVAKHEHSLRTLIKDLQERADEAAAVGSLFMANIKQPQQKASPIRSKKSKKATAKAEVEVVGKF